MANDILGVEITTKRVKLVQVSKGRAVRFSSTVVPDDCIQDGLIVAWDALEEALRNAVKEGHFSTKKTAVVIPDAACYVRRMVLPAMSESQLKVNMPYEFKDIIQDDKEHYTFDYSMIGMKYGEGDAQAPKEMELLGAAIQNDMLEHYQQLFLHAGLKLVKATPRIIALQELMSSLSEENLAHDTAVLDLGYHETKVDIFHNGIYEATRSIDAGAEDVASAIADKLNCDPHIALTYLESNHDDVLASQECKDVYTKIAVEVMRAINYYTYENQSNTLKNLYYDGYGAWIQPFVQEVANAVALSLIPLSSFDESQQDALLNGAAALGACLE